MTDEVGICTFTKSQKQYVFQPVYRCRTCQLVGNKGMCHICVNKCHKGHDTTYDYAGMFFCDCGLKGSSFCKSLVESELPTINSDGAGASCMKQTFECPVCMSYMCGAIHMCTRGHNLCDACKAKITECPTCRGKFTGTRNFAMESLSQALEIPCEDCGKNILIADLNNHKTVCLMNSYKCPLKLQCTWVGKIWDIFDHCQHIHRSQVLSGPHHSFENINFTNNEESEVTLIETSGTLFLFNRNFSIKGNLFQGVVKYVVPRDDCSFTYTLQFTAVNSRESIQFTKNVQQWSEHIDEMYKLHNCVTLYMSQATAILEVNSLKYTLKIDTIN